MRRPRSFIGPAGMGGLVSLWGASSLIRSVQYGTISTTTASGTATITAVDTANAIVCRLGGTNSGANSQNLLESDGAYTLTNGTTVTFNATGAPSGGTNVWGFCVVEFAPGVFKSIQQVNAASNTTTTITAVNTAKTFLLHLGNLGFSFPAFDLLLSPRLTLTNSTTITSVVTLGGYYNYTKIVVVEGF